MSAQDEIEKIMRMRKAAREDEHPLVESLRSLGFEAWRNNDASRQRREGDVHFRRHGELGVVSSFECQVTDTNRNFSYSKHKVTEYRGPDGNEWAYVFLGCKAKSSEEMIYCVVRSIELNEFLNGTTGFQDMGKYYIFSPASLGNVVTGPFAMASDIKTALELFMESLKENKT